MNIQPTRLSRAIIAGVAALFVSAGTAQAAFIIKPTAATVSDPGDHGPEPAINGAGFTTGEQALLETGDPIPVSWPDSDAGWNVSWRTWVGAHVTDATEWIQLDLGAAYSVTGMHFWNYLEDGGTENANRNRGSETINVLLSTDGGANFSPVLSDYDLVRYAEDLTNAPFGETIDFGGTYNGVDTIRIEVTEAYGYAGVGEVRFIGVPEPGSLALLGLGGLCMLKRRRRDA